MLKGIPPLLGPSLLKHLRAMGHGDTVAIVDANFPARRVARRLVRNESVDSTLMLDAILSVLPLDTYSPNPARVMSVVGSDGELAPIAAEFEALLNKHGADTCERLLKPLERADFYSEASDAFVVVLTGERRLYGNIILTKGVIEDAVIKTSLNL